jgi:hypothetical protein
MPNRERGEKLKKEALKKIRRKQASGGSSSLLTRLS